MKILEQTDSRLKLEHRPIEHWLWGGLLVVGSCGFLIYQTCFVSISASLRCDRSSRNQIITCQLNRFYILRAPERQSMVNPNSATVIVKQGKGSKSYQVVIDAPEADIPLLSQTNSSAAENQQVATQVNEFINSDQPTVTVWQRNQSSVSFGLFLGVVFGAIGAFFVTTPSTTCTFYKRLNKLVIDRQGLRDNQPAEYPLNQILQVAFEDRRRGRTSAREYRAVMILSSGQRVLISSQYTDEQSIRKATYSIQQFLGI